MSDYISRDAAINAVYEAYADGESAYDALENLPAADVWEVKLGVQGYIPRIAIPYHEEEFEERCHNDVWSETRMIAFKDEIDKIPAADVREVKKGRWVEDRALGPICSVCGETAAAGYDEEPWPTPYCPFCGARMEEQT